MSLWHCLVNGKIFDKLIKYINYKIMNLVKFTIKSQEAVQKAISIAAGYTNQNIENGHLLKWILETDENVTSFILKKLNVNIKNFTQVLDSIVESYPKVTGNKEYFSRDVEKTFRKAEKMSTDMGDQFITIEHLLYGILASGDSISQLMKDNGITEKHLKKAIEDIRKGSKATSSSAENTYNSLDRFAVNLNESAKLGKLDPVDVMMR